MHSKGSISTLFRQQPCYFCRNLSLRQTPLTSCRWKTRSGQDLSESQGVYAILGYVRLHSSVPPEDMPSNSMTLSLDISLLQQMCSDLQQVTIVRRLQGFTLATLEVALSLGLTAKLKSSITLMSLTHYSIGQSTQHLHQRNERQSQALFRESPKWEAVVGQVQGRIETSTYLPRVENNGSG
ncbi:hypothetical protein BDW22DRAFT_1360488 [Trametopsis cervina]|nr:hypothetical protein BDW22DRAFT_1360488 [Trametopsis cervina]